MIIHISFFASVYGISLKRSRVRKIALIFQVLVVLKTLVLLMGRLVACNARIAADRQTDRQTDLHRPSTVTLVAHVHRGLRNAKILLLTLTRQICVAFILV